MEHQAFFDIIKRGQAVHLAGIGGVSMGALAEYLHARGACLQGSDRDDSPTVAHLRSLGIPIEIGHRAENIGRAVMVIRTAAINDQNPEIAAALGRGIPVIERAQAWGFIMRGYSSVVCVAGTHGKTSTTSMMSMVTMEADLDPVIMVGGTLPAIGGPLRNGRGDTFVAEACEYKNSFLSFAPTVAVILNIDRDHLDFFGDTDDIIASFRRFAQLVPESGTVVANHDDINTMRAVRDSGRTVLTFGSDATADVYPTELRAERGFHSCEVMHGGAHYASLRLSVPGRHSLQNALATAAVAISLGIPGKAFAEGIRAYTGVGRRFQFIKNWHGGDVFDDYAHHPNEIIASIETARSMEPRRLICVFQPHTYSRTASLMDDFAAALALADLPVLCPIYAAREAPIPGVTADKLAHLTPGGVYVPSLADAAALLEREAQEGDLILLMGAGDIWKLSDLLK